MVANLLLGINSVDKPNIWLSGVSFQDQIIKFYLMINYFFPWYRYVNLDTQDKNALVSLSLTDEPIAVDVVRHSNRDKV